MIHTPYRQSPVGVSRAALELLENGISFTNPDDTNAKAQPRAPRQSPQLDSAAAGSLIHGLEPVQKQRSVSTPRFPVTPGTRIKPMRETSDPLDLQLHKKPFLDRQTSRSHSLGGIKGHATNVATSSVAPVFRQNDCQEHGIVTRAEGVALTQPPSIQSAMLARPLEESLGRQQAQRKHGLPQGKEANGRSRQAEENGEPLTMQQLDGHLIDGGLRKAKSIWIDKDAIHRDLARLKSQVACLDQLKSVKSQRHQGADGKRNQDTGQGVANNGQVVERLPVSIPTTTTGYGLETCSSGWNKSVAEVARGKQERQKSWLKEGDKTCESHLLLGRSVSSQDRSIGCPKKTSPSLWPRPKSMGLGTAAGDMSSTSQLLATKQRTEHLTKKSWHVQKAAGHPAARHGHSRLSTSTTMHCHQPKSPTRKPMTRGWTVRVRDQYAGQGQTATETRRAEMGQAKVEEVKQEGETAGKEDVSGGNQTDGIAGPTSLLGQVPGSYPAHLDAVDVVEGPFNDTASETRRRGLWKKAKAVCGWIAPWAVALGVRYCKLVVLILQPRSEFWERNARAETTLQDYAMLTLACPGVLVVVSAMLWVLQHAAMARMVLEGMVKEARAEMLFQLGW